MAVPPASAGSHVRPTTTRPWMLRRPRTEVTNDMAASESSTRCARIPSLRYSFSSNPKRPRLALSASGLPSPKM
eukprot:160339-Prymnesium_polylepis.2